MNLQIAAPSSTTPGIVLVTYPALLLTLALSFKEIILRHHTLKESKMHVKQKVSQAVLTRSATINNAKAMHKFLTEKFTQPAASSFTARTNSVQLKHRVFFYVPGKGEGAVIRNRPGRKFKEVKGIRKLHCIKTGSEQEKVLARQHSRYCISCTHDDEENCSNKAWLDDWKEVLVNCKL